ncbi:S1 RNA-binding domain-containing protein [Mechercharimyces sp. CAU 1602]|nr:S1 RNA-binding domain-containing protein [Mechercharimyces sp. CAU 1602]
MSQLTEGSVISGEVVAIKPFGAFVKIESGETGLVHISQLSAKYVEKVEDELSVGDTVKAKVLKVDPSGKISLSIKALSEERPRNNNRRSGGGGGGGGRRGGPGDFEDMMKKWAKSSEERLSALAAKQKKGR